MRTTAEPATGSGTGTELAPHELVAMLDAAVAGLAAVSVDSQSAAGLQELIAGVAAATGRLGGVVSRALGELHVRSGGQVPGGTAADGAASDGAASDGVASDGAAADGAAADGAAADEAASDGAAADEAAADEAATLSSTTSWLRETAHLSARRARAQVRTATALRELPRIAAAVVAGQITAEHAAVLARLVGVLAPEALLETQEQMITVAQATDPDGLGHYVAHLIATWREPELDAQERKAEARRYLQLVDNDGGGWSGRFALPNAAIETIRTVLEPLARRGGVADDRSAGQRRADALVDVFARALRHDDLPEAGADRTRITVVVPAEWAAGMSPPPFGSEPAERWCASALWTGPVTRSTVATLGCAAQLEVLRITGHGTVLSLTALTEAITAAQRRAVTARDRHCVARGCTRAPSCCDVHHVQARAEGGATAVENLVLLCRRHHTSWHRGEIGLADVHAPWLEQARARAGPGVVG